MRVAEKSIWINRQPQDIFDFHANRVTWHNHVIRSEMVTPSPVGLGSHFEIDNISAGRPASMAIEITVFGRLQAYSYRAYTSSANTDIHQTFR